MNINFIINSNFSESYDLWKLTLAKIWDISFDTYHDALSNKYYLCAYDDSYLVGFVAYDFNFSNLLGSVSLIIISPEYQRRGIGRKLLAEVKRKLTELGAEKIMLCSCGLGGLWRALPQNIKGADAFFSHNGWNLNAESLDQTGNIEDYQSPEFLNIRPRRKDLFFHFYKPQYKSSLLDFQRNNFPYWRIYFEKFIEQGNFENIIVACLNNELIGSCLLEYPGQRFMGSNWVNMLGADCGSPSVLGVSEEHRGYGVGYYLFDHAMATLAARGAKHAFINESDAPSVYKRFGFEVIWQYRQGICAL